MKKLMSKILMLLIISMQLLILYNGYKSNEKAKIDNANFIKKCITMPPECECRVTYEMSSLILMSGGKYYPVISYRKNGILVHEKLQYVELKL